MTRVLLTGAGGFVGSHVLEVLLSDTDWEVVVVDSYRHNGAFDNTGRVVHEAWREGVTGSVQSVVHDLVAPFSPRQAGEIGKLDYIIHVASRCSVPDSIDDPAQFVRNNIESTLTILELARAQWCWEGRDAKLFDHRLVHLSTDEVHGPTSPEGALPTDSIHRPSSPYAASKAAQEDLVHAWQRTYDIPATIVSSANMFGERQSLLAYIPRVISAIMGGRKLSVHSWRGQPGRRRYTYVRNTAQAIVDHLTSPRAPSTQLARLSLPGQHSIDNLELALRIAGMIGRPLRYELVAVEAQRPGYDPDYAPLGGDPNWADLTFPDGLERTVRWYVDHPEWLT